MVLALPDNASLDEATETLKFLSDRNRLRILTSLARAETCVCDLIDELDLTQPLVSYHLAKLRKAGLVLARRDAQWVYYSLDPEAWARLTAPLAGLFRPVEFPPEAAFGASNRCDLVPADPAHGACPTVDGDCELIRQPPHDSP
ncbi:MAG: winged helix-turn-helix transcriptional regulator [Chloroflexia bacterium]|nr:winged helix-turn-helix transcriptional regulator [Chloroflexia bacterium]